MYVCIHLFSGPSSLLTTISLLHEAMMTINSLTIRPGNAVLGVVMHSTSHAFIEVRTITEASNTLVLDGVQYQGHSLVICWSRENLIPPAQGQFSDFHGCYTICRSNYIIICCLYRLHHRNPWGGPNRRPDRTLSVKSEGS